MEVIVKAFAIFCLIGFVCGGKLPTNIKPLTPKEAERISKWTPEKGNAWQLSGQFEGDMVLSSKQQRNGVADEDRRWPDTTIYYEIDGFTTAQKDTIRQVIAEIQAETCLVFKARNEESEYIWITDYDNGCWSEIGYLGGQTQMNLQREVCTYKGSVIHEFLHALGFVHQHNVPNRDDYIEIQWENIKAGEEVYFQKYDADVITDFGTEYDYNSIMHYDAYAYSANGEKTILTKNDEEIGQRLYLSSGDIEKLNAMYC